MYKRILTVTLNPAIDINYPIPDFKTNEIRRVSESFKSAGGKGINVARVASELGLDVTCTGIIGGQFGQWLAHDLNRSGINHDFLTVDAETRLCLAITNQTSQTEILESGETHTNETVQRFSSHFEQQVPHFDLVVISGSLPKGFPKDYYVTLLKIAHQHQTPVCLDTSGETLAYTLAQATDCAPYFVKPNEDEIKMLIQDQNEALETTLTSPALDHLPHILVSLGKDGAVLRTDHTLYRYTVPPLQVVNPVGSGDSAVAGFCHGLCNGLSPIEAVTHSMAAGMANALEQRTGHVNPDNFNQFITQIEYTKVVTHHDKNN